jgi:hypothetical protein
MFGFRGLIETAKSLMTPRKLSVWLSVPLKGFYSKNKYMGTPTKKVGFRGLYDFDNLRLDFLGEFEAIFKTALAHESGP